MNWHLPCPPSVSPVIFYFSLKIRFASSEFLVICIFCNNNRRIRINEGLCNRQTNELQNRGFWFYLHRSRTSQRETTGCFQRDQPHSQIVHRKAKRVKIKKLKTVAEMNSAAVCGWIGRREKREEWTYPARTGKQCFSSVHSQIRVANKALHSRQRRLYFHFYLVATKVQPKSASIWRSCSRSLWIRYVCH